MVCLCCFLKVLAQPNITAAEYFIDTDPGFGNGTTISLTPAINITNNAFNVGIGSLTPGIHTLFIRSKNANGKWSITNTRLFYKSATNNSLSNIVNAEYFFDTDPGFGNATSITISPSVNVIDNIFNAAIGSLTPGLHIFFIRSKNATGNWSITNAKIFYKSVSSSISNITKAEYFFDMDPGFGSATAIPITPSGNIIDNAFNAAIGSLTQGLHFLFLRSKSATGYWSITNTKVFYKSSSGSLSNIINAEYFFDTDPGFGNATNIPLTAGTNLQNINFSAAIGSITNGFHYLFLRSKDANGRWSITDHIPFYKIGSIASGNIMQAEYFIDTDPGFGNATNLSISSSTNIQNSLINLSTANLADGIHFLFLRARDAKGSWSITNKFVFVKLKRDLINNITNLEYFIDNEPGFGKAVPIAINPANDIHDLIAPVNISGLSAGNHNLFVRSRANNGWSMTNMITFPIASTASTPFINVNAITKKLMCARDSVNISYDAVGTFNAGNIFKVELSDATGVFSLTPPIIGTYTGTVSTIVKCILPSHTPDGIYYRVRVSSTNPVVTGATGSDSIVIHDRPFAQTVTGDPNVNAGFSYPYSVPSFAGSSWQWLVPAATISQTGNSASLLWNIVGQPQSIKVVETNQFGCVGDTSGKNVNVYPLKITNTTPSTFTPCPGSSLTIGANAYGVYYPGNIFTAQLSDASGSFASPVSIGTYSPATQPLGNAQPITINATMPVSLVNGSNYRTRITSNNYSVTSDTSAAIVIVRPSPSFSINSNPQCHGGNNFIFTNTSTITSGTMTYQWYFGDNTTSTTVSPSHIYLAVGNYTVKLVATSNLGCKDSVSTAVTLNNCGVYTFIGNGDWLTPSNWLNNLVPPTTIPNNMNVTINPTTGGQCFYIGTITLQAGGVITVNAGKAFNIRLQ